MSRNVVCALLRENCFLVGTSYCGENLILECFNTSTSTGYLIYCYITVTRWKAILVARNLTWFGKWLNEYQTVVTLGKEVLSGFAHFSFRAALPKNFLAWFLQMFVQRREGNVNESVWGGFKACEHLLFLLKSTTTTQVERRNRNVMRKLPSSNYWFFLQFTFGVSFVGSSSVQVAPSVRSVSLRSSALGIF